MLKCYISVLLIIILTGANACTVVNTAGGVAKVVGKVGWETAKLTGKAAWGAAKLTHKGIRTVIYMAKGKQIVPLRREGSSLYAEIELNGKAKADFLIDTGASNMLISRSMAERLGISLSKAEVTSATIAGGKVVPAYVIYLEKVELGSITVNNVRALVFDHDNMKMNDGLLGMSFLNHFVFKIDSQKPELILERRVID